MHLTVEEDDVARHVLSPEEGEELKQLYLQKIAATKRCVEELREHGMDSVQFYEAHEAESAITCRIKEILDIGGQNWMA